MRERRKYAIKEKIFHFSCIANFFIWLRRSKRFKFITRSNIKVWLNYTQNLFFVKKPAPGPAPVVAPGSKGGKLILALIHHLTFHWRHQTSWCTIITLRSTSIAILPISCRAGTGWSTSSSGRNFSRTQSEFTIRTSPSNSASIRTHFSFHRTGNWRS